MDREWTDADVDRDLRNWRAGVRGAPKSERQVGIERAASLLLQVEDIGWWQGSIDRVLADVIELRGEKALCSLVPWVFDNPPSVLCSSPYAACEALAYGRWKGNALTLRAWEQEAAA